MEKYYVGVNFEDLVNKKVTVLDELYKFGKNNIPVYCCVDEDGCTYKILETNLSAEPAINRKFIRWGLQVCFPESVLRFESFTPRGKYIADVQ